MGVSNHKNGKKEQSRHPGQHKPELEKLLSVLACQELVDAADTCKVLWAKVKGHPYWPAQIMSAKAANQMMKGIHRNKEHTQPVQFFGTLEIAWMREVDTVMWRQGMGSGYFQKGKSKRQFMNSLQQVQTFLLRRKAPEGWWGKPPDKRVLPLTGAISNVTTRRATNVLEGEENGKSAVVNKYGSNHKPKQAEAAKGGATSKSAKDSKARPVDKNMKPAEPVPPVPTRKTRNSLGVAPPTSESEPPTPSGRRTRRSLQAGTLTELDAGVLPTPVRQKPKPKVSESEDDDEDEDDDVDDEEEEKDVKHEEVKVEAATEGIRTRRTKLAKGEDVPKKQGDLGAEKGGGGSRKTPREEPEPPVRSVPPRARAKAAAVAAAAAAAAAAASVEQQEASSTTVARAERSNSGAVLGLELDVSMGSNDAGQSSVADESAESDKPRRSARAQDRRADENQHKSKESSRPTATKRPEPKDGKQQQQQHLDAQRISADQSASGRISRNGRVIKPPRRPGSQEETPKEAPAKEQRDPPPSKEPKEVVPAKPAVQPKRKFPDPKAQDACKPPVQRRRIIQMPGIPMSVLQKGKSTLLGHLRTQGGSHDPQVTPFVDFCAPTASSRQHTPEAITDNAPEAASGSRPFAHQSRHGSGAHASALDAIRRPSAAAPPKKKSIKQKLKELPHDCHILEQDLVHDNLPSYEAIKRNIYLGRERPKRQAKSKIQVCMCTPVLDAAGTGLTGCNKDCLNLASMLTCDTRLCPCALYCNNKPFYLRPLPKLRVYHTGSRGWGVKAVDGLAKGDFICEYVGEVINWLECSKRMEDAKREGEAGAAFYMMELEPGLIIDARRKGNLARMLNSSCDPNAETRKWHDSASGETHIVICAKRRIEPGEEVTYDYQFEHYGLGDMVTKYRCLCGSANCRGTMDREPERRKDFGRRVEVWWEADGAYYRGSVRSFNPKTNKHVILYDDNEEERVNLQEVPHRWLDVTAPMQPTPPELAHVARRQEQIGERPGQASTSFAHKARKGEMGREGGGGSDLPSAWLHGKLGYKLHKPKMPVTARPQQQGSDEGEDDSSMEEDAAASLMTILYSPPGPVAAPPASSIERLAPSSLRPQPKHEKKPNLSAHTEAQPTQRPCPQSDKQQRAMARADHRPLPAVAVKQERTQRPSSPTEAPQPPPRPAAQGAGAQASIANPTVHGPQPSAQHTALPRRDTERTAAATQGPSAAAVPVSQQVSCPASGPSVPPGMIPVQAMPAWAGGPPIGTHPAAMAAFAGLPPQVQAQAQAQAQAAAAAHAQAQAQAAAFQQHLLQQQISAQVAALQAAGVPSNQISAALQMGIFQNGVPNGRPPALLLPQGAVMLAQRPPFMAGQMPPCSTVAAAPATAPLPAARPGPSQAAGSGQSTKQKSQNVVALPPPPQPQSDKQPKKPPAESKKSALPVPGTAQQGPPPAAKAAASARGPVVTTAPEVPSNAEDRSAPGAEARDKTAPPSAAEGTTAGPREGGAQGVGAKPPGPGSDAEASLPVAAGRPPQEAAAAMPPPMQQAPAESIPTAAPVAQAGTAVDVTAGAPRASEHQPVSAQGGPVLPVASQQSPVLPATSPQQAAQAALASLAAAGANKPSSSCPPQDHTAPAEGPVAFVADAAAADATGEVSTAAAQLMKQPKLPLRESSSASTGGAFSVGGTEAGAPSLANGGSTQAHATAPQP